MSCRLGKLTPQPLHRRATPESAPAREAAAEAALRRDGRRTAAGRTMSRPRARLRPKTARHGARRRAPATQHSMAHPGHRPQRRVRVGRVRGRACAALRRGPTYLVVASTLSRSVPARGPRSLLVAGVTRRRAEPACGRAATTRGSTQRVDRPRPRGRRPPPAGREGQGQAPSQARPDRARHGPVRTRVRVRPRRM